jgi:hypothetical protein
VLWWLNYKLLINWESSSLNLLAIRYWHVGSNSHASGLSTMWVTWLNKWQSTSRLLFALAKCAFVSHSTSVMGFWQVCDGCKKLPWSTKAPLPNSTLNMTFSVTYNWEFHNAKSIYRISHILPTNGKFIVWALYHINNFTW